MAKDWRVLYSTSDSNIRSKPFETEDQALAWSITWVKGQDADIDPAAHVLHRTQVSSDEDDLDPTPPSHRVSWAPVGEELRVVKRTWPSQSLAAHHAETRRVMADLGKPDGAKVYTETELVDDMPLRVL